MIKRRLAIGSGLGILLAIGATSAALDIKSRHEVAWVNHTLGVLQKTSDLRVLLRQAEAASRGFALSRTQGFVDEFKAAGGRLPQAFAELRDAVADNPTQRAHLDGLADLIARRVELLDELIRLSAADDRAGVEALLARAEGRAAMAIISERLDRFATEERRLLAERSAISQSTGTMLLTVDLAGVALVLAIAAYLLRRAYLSDRTLRSSLTRSRAETSSLEAQAVTHQDHLMTAYQELQHSSAILENTFNTMAEGVLVVDLDGKVALFNKAAARIFGAEAGKTFADMVGHNRFFEDDGSKEVPREELPIARALRGEAFDRREVVVKPGDGRPWFRLMVSGRPLHGPDDAVNGAAMVYHDITDAHETERLLQQAQKLDAIGKLTGGVAHDFNNMLTIITGSIEALGDDLKDRPTAAEIAGLIGKAAERCTELIRHLLAFARKQPLRPRDIDVNAAVVDIAKLLRPTLGEQIDIATILSDETLNAHVDSAQFANSLVNLAINARDAMPEGGKLLIETDKVVLDEAYAQQTASALPGTYIVIAVSDTGQGMPAAVLDRAFEPFFTTKEAGKGSGLGLSMVYGFAKQSGGHVKIYSEQGRGTTIRLYLPPVQASAAAEAVPEGPAPRGEETILVVEDDPLVRDYVLGQLQSLGYKTVTAARGADALARVEAGEPFDLVFTDIIMPGGMNGKELTDAVLRLRPDAKVLYTSGYTDNAIVEHGQLDRDALLLTKPYRRTELAHMVRRALDTRADERESQG